MDGKGNSENESGQKSENNDCGRAVIIISEYYDMLLQNRGRNLTGEESAKTREMHRRFDQWLYDAGELSDRIKAVELYYFDFIPGDEAVRKDILFRLQKLYELYGEQIERGDAPKRPISKRVKSKIGD